VYYTVRGVRKRARRRARVRASTSAPQNDVVSGSVRTAAYGYGRFRRTSHGCPLRARTLVCGAGSAHSRRTFRYESRAGCSDVTSMRRRSRESCVRNSCVRCTAGSTRAEGLIRAPEIRGGGRGSAINARSTNTVCKASCAADRDSNLRKLVVLRPTCTRGSGIRMSRGGSRCTRRMSDTRVHTGSGPG